MKYLNSKGNEVVYNDLLTLFKESRKQRNDLFGTYVSIAKGDILRLDVIADKVNELVVEYKRYLGNLEVLSNEVATEKKRLDDEQFIKTLSNLSEEKRREALDILQASK